MRVDDLMYQTRVVYLSLNNFKLTDFSSFSQFQLITIVTLFKRFCHLEPNFTRKIRKLLKRFWLHFLLFNNTPFCLYVMATDESINFINFINRRCCECDGRKK